MSQENAENPPLSPNVSSTPRFQQARDTREEFNSTNSTNNMSFGLIKSPIMANGLNLDPFDYKPPTMAYSGSTSEQLLSSGRLVNSSPREIHSDNNSTTSSSEAGVSLQTKGERE
ncbi:unnamed protein product [Pichia kudriavzevii]